MEDRNNFKYKIPVELNGEPQQIVGYRLVDDNGILYLQVGQASKDDVAYIDNVRLLFNGEFYNRCISINDSNTLGVIVPIALDFPFTSINWDFSGDTKYFCTNDNLTVYLEGSNDSATIEDLLSENSNPNESNEYIYPTIDTTLYKYRFSCIGLVIDGVIERLAINIKGVFYPYLLYDASLLYLYDHTLGEDESFNKVGYYYSNEPLLLQITDMALESYTTDDFYLNPDYLNKLVLIYKNLYNQALDTNAVVNELIVLYQNEITELEKLVELLRSQHGSDVTPGYNDPAKDGLFIDIFRISPDGKYLEIDMTTGNSYMFKSVNIYNYTTKDKYYDVLAEIDLNDLIEIYTGNSKQYRLLVRIDIELLGGSSLYYGSIEVEKFEGEPEEIIDSNKIFEVATSDISNVYFYLLPGLVQLKNPCDPCDLEIPIEIQRAFLIMWAHIEAMRLERWAEAEMFYDLIKNNFLHCLSVFEVKPKSCNCHAKKLSNFNYSR